MKILGISGSPRQGGNTETLVRAVLEGAAARGCDTELVSLGGLQIGECLGCNQCADTFRCVLRDDMQSLYQKLEEADGLVLGSPTYFYQVTGLTKLFLDRLYVYEGFDEKARSVWLSPNEVFGLKYAVTVAVCEQRDEADMGYTSIAMDRTLQAVGCRVVDSVKALRLFARGEAQKDEEQLEKARRAGNRLADTLLLAQKVRQSR